MAMLREAYHLVEVCKKSAYSFESKEILTAIGNISAVVTLMLRSGDIPHPPTDEQIYGRIKQMEAAGIK